MNIHRVRHKDIVLFMNDHGYDDDAVTFTVWIVGGGGGIDIDIVLYCVVGYLVKLTNQTKTYGIVINKNHNNIPRTRYRTSSRVVPRVCFVLWGWKKLQWKYEYFTLPLLCHCVNIIIIILFIV